MSKIEFKLSVLESSSSLQSPFYTDSSCSIVYENPFYTLKESELPKKFYIPKESTIHISSRLKKSSEWLPLVSAISIIGDVNLNTNELIEEVNKILEYL